MSDIFQYYSSIQLLLIKVGCVFPVVVVSILPHAEFGRNVHREEAPYFIILDQVSSLKYYWIYMYS